MNHKPFPRIVVPLDGSALAESAVVPAVELARRVGVWISFIHVVTEEAARPTGHDYLRRAADRLAPGLVDQLAVRNASSSLHPVEIVGEAAFDGALVCMATHGRSGVEQTRLGSVAAEALRLSAHPLLLVGPAIDPHREIGRGAVVACLDGSQFAESVLPAASSWAELLRAPLWLVEVDAETRPRHDPRSYLGATSAMAARGAPWQVIGGSSVSDELVGLVARHPIGLLAMATHGRTGRLQEAVGSVTMDVVRRAPCPVLVVRSRTLDAGG